LAFNKINTFVLFVVLFVVVVAGYSARGDAPRLSPTTTPPRVVVPFFLVLVLVFFCFRFCIPVFFRCASTDIHKSDSGPLIRRAACACGLGGGAKVLESRSNT
jgi:hypothetical protein